MSRRCRRYFGAWGCERFRSNIVVSILSNINILVVKTLLIMHVSQVLRVIASFELAPRFSLTHMPKALPDLISSRK